HGECVLQGILIECSIFADLCEPAYLDEIRDLLRKLIQNKIKILPQSIADAAMHDKKNLDEKIHFVVPVNLGQTKETTATKEEFVRRLKAFAKSEENFVYPAF
ncbi:MAG: hypothetical protein FWD76_06555, partial [Firmicutes bacterium]|nr:hypothetical protein [Bacillota bacterium]